VSGGVGSGSDRLFDSMRETTFRGMADLRVPSASGNAWIFLLAYSNSRYFLNNVPLAGVAYEFRVRAAPLSRGFTLDVSGGRQFDQYFYEGRRLATGARASLPPCWYVSTSLAWHFRLGL